MDDRAGSWDTPLLLTVPEVCQLLGIGKTLCWQLLYNEADPIPHVRMGSRVLIPRAALATWIVANTIATRRGAGHEQS